MLNSPVFTQVEKELVSALQFPVNDVLSNADQRQMRMQSLIRAMHLGNNHKRKVKIYFVDNEGDKMVETTIWLVTEENIALKTGSVIPVSRIRAVELY